MSKWDEGTLPGSHESVVPSWLATPQAPTARPPSASATPFAPVGEIGAREPSASPDAACSQATRAASGAASSLGTIGQHWSVGGLAGPVAVPGRLPLDVEVPGRAAAARPRSAHHVAEAGHSGALSASNAAAEGSRLGRAERRGAAEREAEPFQLIWVDGSRIEDARVAYDRGSDDDASWLRCEDFASGEKEDGRARAARLLGGAVFESHALEPLLFESADASGLVARTHALIRGELSLLVDARERLRRLYQAVEPHAGVDRRLADAAAQAKEVSTREVATTEAVRHATLRLLEVGATAWRPMGDIEATVDGTLLAERRLERRTLLGGEVALATFSDGGAPLRCYVPVAALAEMPPRRQLSVRLLVEVVPQQEDDDDSEIALAVVAVGRRLGRTRSRPPRQTRT